MSSATANKGAETKPDYNLIREILEKVQETGDGFSDNVIPVSEFPCGGRDPLKVLHNYNLLVKNGLIEGRAGRTPPKSFRFKRLTLQGHAALDALQDDDIWAHTAKRLNRMGEEGVSKMVDVAVEFFVSHNELGIELKKRFTEAKQERTKGKSLAKGEAKSKSAVAA